LILELKTSGTNQPLKQTTGNVGTLLAKTKAFGAYHK